MEADDEPVSSSLKPMTAKGSVSQSSKSTSEEEQKEILKDS